MAGDHKDAGKPRVELLPVYALMTVGEVMGYGSEKYKKPGRPRQESDGNWRMGIIYSKLIGSTLRHILKFMMREDIDPESGKPHLGHAAADLLMLMEMTQLHPEMDDRWMPQAELEERLAKGLPVVMLEEEEKEIKRCMDSAEPEKDDCHWCNLGFRAEADRTGALMFHKVGEDVEDIRICQRVTA